MSLPASDTSKQPDNLTTMDLGEVLPRTAEVRDNHLFIGGVDMVKLAREEGTALYVFDEADLRHRMETYREAFRSRYENSDIIYASKAFLNKEAARIAAQEGMCLDVSGGGELWCAQQAGFPMERVFVHGNNKTPQELREAISAGVGRIVVDSRIELARVSEIAGELGVTQNIYMRVTPGVEADTHEYIRTGCEDSKFGFTMLNDFAFKCVKDALEAPNVHLAGFHCHIGSQIFALHSFAEAVQVMVEFIARVKETYGYEVEELDMGGGLGIAHRIAHHQHLAALVPAGQHGGDGVGLAAHLLAEDDIGMAGQPVVLPLAGNGALIGGAHHSQVSHGVQLAQAFLHTGERLKGRLQGLDAAVAGIVPLLQFAQGQAAGAQQFVL